MTSMPTGAIVMFAVAFAVAAFMHWRFKNDFFASTLSIISSPFVFVIVSMFRDGIPEAISPKGLVVLAAMALPPAIIVGLVFLFSRRVRANAS